jgi:hypothetical protein
LCVASFLNEPESTKSPLHPLRSLSIILVLLVCVVASIPIPAAAWSVVSHQLITKYAIESLPSSWKTLFEYYSWFLTDAVTYPDVCYRGTDPTEGPRHYVDLEVWNPRDPSTGTLPQAVEEFADKMQLAIEAKDWNSAFLYAARIAHYVEDDTQPYHTTVNYDPANKAGVGLHAVLDSSIATHWSEIHLMPPSDPTTLTPIKNLTAFALSLAIQSHSFLYTINQTLINQGLKWSPELTKIVENRTNTAIASVARVWYTIIEASNSSPPIIPANNQLSVIVENMTYTGSGPVSIRLRVVDSLGVNTYANVTLRAGGSVFRGQVANAIPPVGEYVITSQKQLQPNDSLTAQREGYTGATTVLDGGSISILSATTKPVHSETSSQAGGISVPPLTVVAPIVILAGLLALALLRRASKIR